MFALSEKMFPNLIGSGFGPNLSCLVVPFIMRFIGRSPPVPGASPWAVHLGRKRYFMIHLKPLAGEIRSSISTVTEARIFTPSPGH